jgi:hypothetical protein
MFDFANLPQLTPAALMGQPKPEAVPKPPAIAGAAKKGVAAGTDPTSEEARKAQEEMGQNVAEGADGGLAAMLAEAMAGLAGMGGAEKKADKAGAAADDMGVMAAPINGPSAKPEDDKKQFQVSTDPRVKAQQLHEAEQDRAKLEENLKSVPGLSDAEKKRIVDRVKDLKGDDLIKEEHALTHILTKDGEGNLGANAEAALGAYADTVAVLNGAIKENNPGENGGDIYKRWQKATKRIDSDMLCSITTGVDDQKETGKGDETDTRGSLSRRGARDAVKAMINMPEEEFQSVKNGLDEVKQAPVKTGPDGKMIKGELADADDATTRQAVMLQAIAARRDNFDKESDGNGESQKGTNAQEELSQLADKLQNMSKDEIVKKTSSAGVTQGYANTCAQTTAQVQKADYDPIYAMKLNDDPQSAFAEQKKLHEESAQGARVRAKDGSEDGVRGGDVQTHADHALDEMSDTTHLKYQKSDKDGELRYGEKALDPTDASTSEKQAEQSHRLDGALQDGQTVPISVRSQFGGHSMSVSNVRGEPGKKQYFVHDPMSGKSQWVSEQAFQDGSFVDSFGIKHDGAKVSLSEVYIGEDN